MNDGEQFATENQQQAGDLMSPSDQCCCSQPSSRAGLEVTWGQLPAQGWAFQGDPAWKPKYVGMPGTESASKAQYLWELSMSLNKLETTEGWRTVDFIDHSLI